MFPNHLDTLQRVRNRYPGRVNADQAVAILNEVAWTHRAEGFGLLAKPAGNSGPQPRTGTKCSVDWLVCKSTSTGSDVLIDGPDAGDGILGTARPTWGDGEPFDASRFVAPVEPIDVVVDPGGGGGAVTFDDTKILEAMNEGRAATLAAIDAQTQAIKDASAATIAKLDEIKGAFIKGSGDLGKALQALAAGGGLADIVKIFQR